MLRNEAAATCAVLQVAADKLLVWAVLLGGADDVIPEELRTLAHQLAKQGGRLSMAAEMTKGKK